MAKHPKGKHNKKNTKAKSKAKVKKLTAINAKTLSRAQKRHIKDFGEVHPINSSDLLESSKKKYKRVEDTEDNVSIPQIPKSTEVELDIDEGSDADNNPYQQLVGSLNNHSHQIVSDVDDDDDEDDEDDMDDDDDAIEDGGSAKPSVLNGSSKHNGSPSDLDNTVDDRDSGNVDDSDDEVDDDKGAALGDEDYRHQDDDDDDDDDIDDDDDDNMKKGQGQVAADAECQDPFMVHFEQDLDETIQAQLSDKQSFQDKTLSDSSIGKVTITEPVIKVPLSDIQLKDSAHLSHFKVKARLWKTWKAMNSCVDKGSFTRLQNGLFNYINSYQDMFFSHRTFGNGEEIRRLYCLHAVNHILKTRSRVLRNNAKIVQAQKEKREPEELRDQGLTRPKVVILVPFKESALRVVNLIIQLLLPEGQGQVMNKKRFHEEYSGVEEAEAKRSHQPDDFKAMFAGNIDDCFRIGLSVMRKAVKLYSEFYSCDIIVASPLGLRTIIGSQGDKSRDYDFLSSVEVLIADQADVFQMQNWEHVTHVLEHLHLQPKDAHDVDFSRVRNWCLNGWSKHYRQTLVFSSIISPELNSLVNTHCHNFAGKVKTSMTDTPGTISQVITQVPQVFHRITCQSFVGSAEDRFNVFVNEILPEFQGPMMGHTAIFIPSYFDFVRLRNHFRRKEIPFAQISEYTKRSDVTRARTRFFDGSRPFLLYTERFYFFYRYRLRGIRNIIFYALPHYPHYYPEILNYLDTGSQSAASSPVTCTLLYTKYDSHRLAGIVGSQRSQHMLSSHKHVHMLVTDEHAT